MKRIAVKLFSLFLFFCLIAFSNAYADEVKIGVLSPHTGPFASGGESLKHSLQIAVENLNNKGGVLGKKIVLISYDTEGRVDKAKVEALKLIEKDKVSAIIGAYLTEETVVVNEVCALKKVINMVPIAASSEITDNVASNYNRYKYIFRVSYSIPQWAEMLGKFIESKGLKKYAFVGANIRWNMELAGVLEKWAAKKGIKKVYETFYSPKNISLEPVFHGLKKSNPEVVIIGDPGKGSLEFTKKYYEKKITYPLLSVGGTLGDTRVVAGLNLPGGLYFQAATYEGNNLKTDNYFNQFKKTFGYKPVGYSDALPYDALIVYASAVEKARSFDTEKVISALESGTFEGLSGVYRFKKNHQADWAGGSKLSGTVVKWENGKGIIVK